MKKKTDFKLNSPLNIIIFALLIIYVISFLYPLIWAFISTFKSYYEFRINVAGLPKKWVFENYQISFMEFKLQIEDGAGFRSVRLLEMFINSFLLSGGVALAYTISHFLAAYATAKYAHYAFSKITTAVVLFTIILPIVGSLPSSLQMAHALGLYNKMWGSWIRGANFMSVYFLVLQGMIAGLPKEFDEAAKIDGASNLRIMLHINLPLLTNILKTLFLLQFIASWNDFRHAMLFLPDYPVVAYGLYIMFMTTDNQVATITVKLTLTMLLLIPMLIIFLFFHNRLMGNLPLGGVKG